MFIVYLLSCLVLLSYIRAAEHEVYVWESSYNELENRLTFLQHFASRMAQGSNMNISLSKEWDYWKKTKGLDWRLAEWQDQMITLESQLTHSLHDVSNILQMVSENPENLLSERHLAQLVSIIDKSKVSSYK